MEVELLETSEMWIRPITHDNNLTFSDQVRYMNDTLMSFGNKLSSTVSRLFGIKTVTKCYPEELDCSVLIGRKNLQEIEYQDLYWDKVKANDFVMEFYINISDRSVILYNLQFPETSTREQKEEFMEYWISLLSERELDVIRTWERLYFTTCWDFLNDLGFTKTEQEILPLHPKASDFHAEVGKYGVPIVYYNEEPLYLVQFVDLKEYQKKQGILDQVGLMLAKLIEEIDDNGDLADELRETINKREQPTNLISLENKIIGNNLGINLSNKKMILLEANWRYQYDMSDMEDYESKSKESVVRYLSTLNTGVTRNRNGSKTR
ncbi:hypothetical protein V7139_16405 [Neobacillus drentensis]|uniref:hypothetical protein n=1 Tax=Neobacillus drentensis TaxID=220684 RepID=UPI0030009DEE